MRNFTVASLSLSGYFQQSLKNWDSSSQHELCSVSLTRSNPCDSAEMNGMIAEVDLVHSAQSWRLEVITLESFDGN